MKSRLSSTVWMLVLLNSIVLFAVLGLAYSAGKQSDIVEGQCQRAKISREFAKDNRACAREDRRDRKGARWQVHGMAEARQPVEPDAA